MKGMPRAAWEPLIDVDRDASLPPFLQIARSLTADIQRGRLRPGDRLPGSRRLAESLEVHRNTVLAALAELTAEGWIETAPGRGRPAHDRHLDAPAVEEPPLDRITHPPSGLGGRAVGQDNAGERADHMVGASWWRAGGGAEEPSRLESKRISLELAQVDVGNLVQDTLARLRPLAGRRELESRPTGADVTVLADRDRLAQVLTNLVDNAIKFTPEDGRIAVGWRGLNGEVEVTVTDTGAGIAAADLPHVFERFYKADRARPAVPGGSGLGLAIAKHIVEAHGGRIRVASTPGTGTTFAFTLPREGN